MYPVIPALILAFVFYLLLPFLGAVMTRRRWRDFRRRIIESSNAPIYGGSRNEQDGDESIFRFFGELEAIEERDIVWLSDGSHRVRVDLSGTLLFVLPGHNLQDQDPLADNSPTVTRWKNLGSLPEGTEFFVYGVLGSDTLVPLFKNSESVPLLVIIHDMPTELFLSRAIRTGRQRNEFWNSISPYSFLSGVLVESLLILSLLQRDADSMLLFLMVPLALLPGLILAPPGIFFYFLYRNTWRKGRKYREERDLLRLPLRYADSILPDGGKYLPQILDGMPEEFLLDGDIRIRHVMAADEEGVQLWSYHAHHSKDPFAEHIYIKGDPLKLADISQKRAVFLEYLSIGYFFAGITVNILLAVLLMLLFWF